MATVVHLRLLRYDWHSYVSIITSEIGAEVLRVYTTTESQPSPTTQTLLCYRPYPYYPYEFLNQGSLHHRYHTLPPIKPINVDREYE